MNDSDPNASAPSPWGASPAKKEGGPPPTSPEDPRLHGAYAGDRASLFSLAFRTALLTAVTLGIYRFWERTRIRRYIWSATAPGGEPFEYTGTGKEKLLGFLIAMVVLGSGLGLLQLVFFFFNLSVFSPAETATDNVVQTLVFQASLLVMIPLYAFAMYRAYRYRMSRTRWRGIRFGVLPGAGGYAWRYMVYVGAAVLTLGALLPLMTFKLEEYRTNRTYFGDARWHQGGNWKMLYPAMRHIGFGVIWLLGAATLGAVGSWGWSILLVLVGWIWVMCGYVHYRVRSYVILTENKVIGDDVRLGADPNTGEVLGCLIVGGFVTVVLGLLVTGAALGLLSAAGFYQVFTSPEMLADGLSWRHQALSIVVTLVSLQIYGVLGLIFVIQPIYAHIIESTWVENPIMLTSIKQRASDEFADADGFADALDVGGAF